MSALIRIVSLALTLLLSAGLAQAQDKAARQAAWETATKAALQGPTDVTFTDEAVLKLPAGMAYIPVAEATAVMRSWGNSVSPGFQGLVVPMDDALWVVTIDQIKDGFVKDEEAKDWNADDLLQSLKDGTAAQNEEREKMGIPALDVVGWVQPPAYDDSLHRLVWSLKAVDRGAAADAEATVNYNTYALGRDGYFEMNLLTGSQHIEQDKPMVHKILSSFAYNPGKRYEDFVPETDHLAEYGIAALIGGVAAKKLGLIALAGVFIAKFAKIILVGAAVLGGAALKLFRRNSPPAA